MNNAALSKIFMHQSLEGVKYTFHDIRNFADVIKDIKMGKLSCIM